MPKAAPQGGLSSAQGVEVIPSRPMTEQPVMPTSMPVMPQQKQPTAEQLAAYNKEIGRPGVTGVWNPQAGAFLMTATAQKPQKPEQYMPPTMPQNPQTVMPPPPPPMPQPEIMVTPPPMPQPEIMVTPPPMPQPSPMPAQGLAGMPPIPPVQNLTLSNVPQTLTLGSTSAPQPSPFDRNASLQQLNSTFGNLRNTYGEEALRGAGFTPAAFQGFQRTLRDLQMDKNSTQEQHTAALQNALNGLNSYTSNLKPISPQGAGIGAFLGKAGEAPQGVGTPPMPSQQLINAFSPKPSQSSFVDTMPKMNMPAPTGPQVMAPNAQGMALGGLMRKYGGMC
jgi:hypothetical protein